MNIQRGSKFNWLTTLKALSDGESITPMQANTLAMRAGSWPTCACGQLCEKLPKIQDGCPRDGTLRQLGTDFYQYVQTQAWCQALATFYAIEERTADILYAMRVREEALLAEQRLSKMGADCAKLARTR
jgi:hypothetical protein